MEQVAKTRKADKRSREKQVFSGFTQEHVDKYFCMPNMATDIIADIDSLAELKVVLYIMRHTWGFHEYDAGKRITVDEFMNGRKCKGERIDVGTKLSEMSVRNGLELAEQHGYITSHTDDTDKAKIKKCYSLHVKRGVKILDPTRKKEVKILGVEVQSLDLRGTKSLPQNAEKSLDFRPRSEKDIPKDTSYKNTEEKDRDLVSFTPQQLAILNWINEDNANTTYHPKQTQKNKEYCEKLVADGITTREQFNARRDLALKYLPTDSNGIVCLGNMVSQKVIEAWKKQSQIPASPLHEVSPISKWSGIIAERYSLNRIKTRKLLLPYLDKMDEMRIDIDTVITMALESCATSETFFHEMEALGEMALLAC